MFKTAAQVTINSFHAT